MQKNCGNDFQKIHTVMFCSSEIFCIEEKLKQQNNKVLAKRNYKAKKQTFQVHWGHQPASGMWRFCTMVRQKFIFARLEWRPIQKCTAACWAQLLSHSMIFSLKAKLVFWTKCSNGTQSKANLVNQTCFRFHHPERWPVAIPDPNSLNYQLW